MKNVFLSWHAFWKEGFNINSINIDIKRKQKKRLAPPLVHLEACTCECPRAAGRENTELNARLLTFGTLLSTTAVSKSTIHIFELSLKTPWKTHHCANFKVISWTKFSLASADAFDYIQSWERVPKKHKQYIVSSSFIYFQQLYCYILQAQAKKYIATYINQLLKHILNQSYQTHSFNYTSYNTFLCFKAPLVFLLNFKTI